jgi:hypothetical protein
MVLLAFLLFLSNMLLLAVLLLLAFLLLLALAVASFPTDPGVPILTGGFTYWIVERNIIHYRAIINRGMTCTIMYFIQHCFICRPSDSTVSEDAGIEPRSVATSALAVRRSSLWAISHPQVGYISSTARLYLIELWDYDYQTVIFFFYRTIGITNIKFILFIEPKYCIHISDNTIFIIFSFHVSGYKLLNIHML